MKKWIVLTAIIAGACGRFGNEETQSQSNERIVCLAKQYSEILYALDATDHLVAVDLSSTYPPEIKQLTTVGYHRALSAEAILATQPTLILHDNNIGPEHVVKQLEDLKIPMKVFTSEGKDPESAKALFREMGKWAGKEEKAEELCAKLDRELGEALEQRTHYTDTPKVMIIHYGRAMNTYLVMTNKSNGARMIEWAGGAMPFEGERGMRPLSPEVIAMTDPDVIILTDFGYDRLGSMEKILELPGISGTKAARDGRIYRFEEHDMVYIGPRTGENVLKLQKLIHAQP